MQRKRFWIFLAFSLLILPPAPTTFAYDSCGYTLEWLCTFKPVIVVARVVSITSTNPFPNAPKFVSADIVCKQTECLKGNPVSSILFNFQGTDSPGQPDTAYLLFLDQSFQVVYWINLDNTATQGKRGVAYTKTGQILTEKDAILTLVRERLQNHPTILPMSERLLHLENALLIEAPAPASHALYALSSTSLYVPPDPEFKNHFLDLYKHYKNDPERRGWNSVFDWVHSIAPLCYYLDDETLKLLKHDLSDSRYRRYQPEIDLYPVRQFAYETLTAGGRTVEKPDHFSDFFQYDIGTCRCSGYGFRDPATKKSIQFREVENQPPDATR